MCVYNLPKKKKNISKTSNIALSIGNKHFAYIVKIQIQFFLGKRV